MREIPVMVWTGATVVSVPEKTRIVKLVAVAGPVKLTVTEALAATRLVMLGAAGTATGKVASLNCRRSTFHTVSMPSAPPLLSTVMLPLAFDVIV